MKTEFRKIDLKSALIGSVAGAAIMLSIAAATNPDHRPNWEYKVVLGEVGGSRITLGDEITKSSDQGWDFVSASPTENHYGFAVMRRERR